MDKINKQLLEAEVAQGVLFNTAWNDTVLPFFEAKAKELHEAFLSAKTSDTIALQQIKMQHNVLLSMKEHFEHYINTGKMATKTLEENDNGDRK